MPLLPFPDQMEQRHNQAQLNAALKWIRTFCDYPNRCDSVLLSDSHPPPIHLAIYIKHAQLTRRRLHNECHQLTDLSCVFHQRCRHNQPEFHRDRRHGNHLQYRGVGRVVRPLEFCYRSFVNLQHRSSGRPFCNHGNRTHAWLTEFVQQIHRNS